MPMVFHSRHSGVPVVMEDGQISQKINSESLESEKETMISDKGTTHIGIDKTEKRITMVRPNADATNREEAPALPGLMEAKPLLILFLWYFFSAITLFLNKYLVIYTEVDTILVATVQMVTTTLMGLMNMYYPCGMYRPGPSEPRNFKFYRNMAMVGSTRFLVTLLGLIALKYVAVSFTETVKSSAPLFTVFMSKLMLGEQNGGYVLCSLIPIMSGLALCSAYELSFNIEGFLAALGTNISECLQFVLSKMFISGDKHKVSPAEFQFYTCFASLILQMPVCLYLADYDAVLKTDRYLLGLIIINGISYHFQTMMAWVLMSFVSPVTHSVCNTVKRAILIWLSVLIFRNPITFLSGLGTCIVTLGVFMYNKAREYEQSRRNLALRYESNHKEVQKI